MKILTKYILGEYLRIFVVIILSFSVLFIVVDAVDQMPRFMRDGASLGTIALYFVLRLPYLFTLTSPVAVLLAGLFFMNTLSKYNESIAIRAAGISILKMVSPLFWFGLVFSFMIMGFGEIVLPKSEAHRSYLKRVKIKKKKMEDKKWRSNIYYRGKNNNLYSIGFFDGYRNNLKTIDITNFDDKNGKVKKKITAVRAEWIDDQWVFEECFIRSFTDGQLVDTKYYKETILEDIDVTPIDFIKSAKKPMAMNFFELKEYIERLKKVGENYTRELVELHFKIAFPFANLIILLFCVPLASTSTRSKGRGLIFLFGLIICFLFLSLLRISQSLGFNGLMSAPLSAWITNIVFTIIGIFFVIKAEV